MRERLEIFDSHFHIIDNRFPLVANNGYLPDTFTVSDYQKRTDEYQLCGGAVVSGSFQMFDQTYMFDALDKLGPSFVGVTQLPSSVSDDEIKQLHRSGIRAIRFNVRRGGSAQVEQLSVMARRIYEMVGWHVELYVDFHDLSNLYNVIVELPAVSIDHMGLSKTGLRCLVRLVEHGVRVKASGFGRLDFAIEPVLQELYAVNPQALMFGTDLPSTRAPRPYQDDDVWRVIDTLGEEAAKDVLSRNAIDFYKPRVLTEKLFT